MPLHRYKHDASIETSTQINCTQLDKNNDVRFTIRLNRIRSNRKISLHWPPVAPSKCPNEYSTTEGQSGVRNQRIGHRLCTKNYPICELALKSFGKPDSDGYHDDKTAKCSGMWRYSPGLDSNVLDWYDILGNYGT